MLGKALLSASVSAPPAAYVEDVFSTWLYTGNGSTQTITNGIDLSGKGGLVWTKARSAAYDHILVDTVRGRPNSLFSNATNAQATASDISSFSSTGYNLGLNQGYENNTGITYASWTFRKAAKFFDVVTYTGNGSNRTIAHSLGSVPGTIIVKRTDSGGDWQVYHRSLANTEYMVLNSTAAKATGTTRWNSTTPTSTIFSLGTDATVNASGGTYVAYLFAHDAGGFGTAGTDSVIKCGGFATDVNGVATIDLGWEPQWILFKRTDGALNWTIFDTQRKWTVNSSNDNSVGLYPNLSALESAQAQISLTATGFYCFNLDSNRNYIYIAIRRGPMKTPTDATKVFNTRTAGQDGGTPPLYNAGFVVDMALERSVNTTVNTNISSRLQGATRLFTNAPDAEGADGSRTFDYQLGWYNQSGTYSNYRSWMFRRAPGFFDVVAYAGTGLTQNVSHNLGVVPEIIIVKSRSATATFWMVYHPVLGKNGAFPNYITLNEGNAKYSGASSGFAADPTSSVFAVGGAGDWGGSGQTYIAYLFATLSGVSKVGSYTGTGTTLSIDCGFTAGARFVMIKRTDSTGDWYVWDTARGIISGNDSYLLLNSTAAEVTNTDYIDPLSSGFQISSTAPAAINNNGGSFIFLAIA